MSRLFICLLTLLLSGCMKSYECGAYEHPMCINYLDTINIKGYTKDHAKVNCQSYEYITYEYVDSVYVDATGNYTDGEIVVYDTLIPQCCDCDRDFIVPN